MSHEPTAMQIVQAELELQGVTDVRTSRVWAAIRWLLAEHSYVKLQEASSSLGVALSNERREAAHWKARFEQALAATMEPEPEVPDGS